jgi:hypothetical protein
VASVRDRGANLNTDRPQRPRPGPG